MTRIFIFLAGQELPLCPEFLGGAAAPPYRRKKMQKELDLYTA